MLSAVLFTGRTLQIGKLARETAILHFSAPPVISISVVSSSCRGIQPPSFERKRLAKGPNPSGQFFSNSAVSVTSATCCRNSVSGFRLFNAASPILLNYVKPEEVNIFERKESGETAITPMSRIPDIQTLLSD
jgi:hypothetical protein